MPAGAVGIFVVLLSGYLSDRWNDRSLVMLICLIPTIIAAAMMYGLDPDGVPKSKGALLFASYLSGTFGAAFMLLLSWNASNIAGHSKKVTANALTLVGFCLGNILVSSLEQLCLQRTNFESGYTNFPRERSTRLQVGEDRHRGMSVCAGLRLLRPPLLQ